MARAQPEMTTTMLSGDTCFTALQTPKERAAQVWIGGVLPGHPIELGHRLGLKVVAEGVETPAQMELLVGQGCDDLQGHLFGPALPTDDFASILAIEKHQSSDTDAADAHYGVPAIF